MLRYMLCIGLLGLSASSLVESLGAQGAPVSSPPQIITTASGVATAVPDRAVVSFVVETRGQTAAAAGVNNARRQQAVFAALRAKGIASERMTTTGFSVHPEERFDKGVRTVVGYVARNGVQVDVHQIDQVGVLIDAALGAGANHVGGLRFYSSQFEEVRRSALAQAVTKARLDAETIAKAAGGTLGDAIELTTMDVGMPSPVYAAAERMAMARDAAPVTPIEVGEQSVRASVTVRWQFVPARR